MILFGVCHRNLCQAVTFHPPRSLLRKPHHPFSNHWFFRRLHRSSCSEILPFQQAFLLQLAEYQNMNTALGLPRGPSRAGFLTASANNALESCLLTGANLILWLVGLSTRWQQQTACGLPRNNSSPSSSLLSLIARPLIRLHHSHRQCGWALTASAVDICYQSRVLHPQLSCRLHLQHPNHAHQHSFNLISIFCY